MIVFFIFNVAFGIYSYNWLGLALGIILRVIFIYIVCKFIQELQQSSVGPISVHVHRQEDAIDYKL